MAEHQVTGPEDGGKYSAWAVLSFVQMSIFVAVETLFFVAFGLSIVIYSHLELPDTVRFGWSLPFFLALNYRRYLYHDAGNGIILAYRKEPESARTRRRRIGLALAILIVVASLVLTFYAPS